MAIADFQNLMLPLLKLTDDGKEHSFNEIADALALQLRLTDDDRKELLPSGQSRFDNRVGWTRTHLKKARFLKAPDEENSA